MYKSEYSPPQTAPLNALRIDYSNGAKSQSGRSISTSAKINRASRVRIASVMSGEGKVYPQGYASYTEKYWQHDIETKNL
jgi:hypothetical protein